MRVWLRSVVDVIRGRVPGKTSRLDTATRMAMDADFSYRREPKAAATPRERGRDDEHLLKPIGASADIALFEELVRVVNEAQERDAEDERRLYRPMPGAWPSQRERLDDSRRGWMRVLLAAGLAICFATQTGKAFAYACNDNYYVNSSGHLVHSPSCA
jgi:hypothetical protein